MLIKFTFNQNGLKSNGAVPANLQLDAGALLALQIKTPTQLQVMSKRIGLTHTASTADYHLHAGDTVLLQRGLVLMELVAILPDESWGSANVMLQAVAGHGRFKVGKQWLAARVRSMGRGFKQPILSGPQHIATSAVSQYRAVQCISG